MPSDHDDATSLAGQWAVVTGASKGIGYGIAERFVDAGANVIIVARGEEALAESQAALRVRAGEGRRVETVVSDTSRPDSVVAPVRTCRRARRAPRRLRRQLRRRLGDAVPRHPVRGVAAHARSQPHRHVPLVPARRPTDARVGSPEPGAARGLVDPCTRRPPRPARVLGDQGRAEPARSGRRPGARTVRDPCQRPVARNHGDADGARGQPGGLRRGDGVGAAGPGRARRPTWARPPSTCAARPAGSSPAPT